MNSPNDTVVEFRNVSERYDLEIIIDGKAVRESFLALQDITFSIRKGESVAIVGPNGSGKSTLLRLIAGLLRPEKGEVKVNGRVGSLLDLTAGFHPELTGRDNLLLNASLYNFSRAEFDAKYEQILKFADIGKFINVPVRCYSQGMYVRLAFSLAIHVDPDILLIDDCLSVGDDNFRMKSIDKALELKAQKKTIVFVTHDFSLARQLCERGIYLKESRIQKDAPVEDALACYLQPAALDRGMYKFIEAKAREEEEKRIFEEQQRIRERERRMQGETLYCGPSLKMVIAPAKVKIFHNDFEMTSDYGLHAFFNFDGIDIHSSSAIWKIKKISDTKVICFVKWAKPRSIFQVWTFEVLNTGVIDLEIIIQSRDIKLIENERVELCLCVPGGLWDKKNLGNKSRVIYCGSESGVLVETLRMDQISGVVTDRKGFLRPYFLTVSDGQEMYNQEGKVRREYFKGRFFSGATKMVPQDNSLKYLKLELGRLWLEFKDGSCRIHAGDVELTAGLGIYTSLHANGIWYDSKQALWKIKDKSSGKLIVEGVWPWISVGQTWEIIKENDQNIIFKFALKAHKKVRIDMQETVLMLSDKYLKWSVDGERKHFLEEFTCDDLFRMCLWAGKADGIASVSAYSDNLPVVNFKPSFLAGHRIIVENAAHIEGVPSRVFHCLRINNKDQSCLEPGEYEFFQGLVNLKEDQL